MVPIFQLYLQALHSHRTASQTGKKGAEIKWVSLCVTFHFYQEGIFFSEYPKKIPLHLTVEPIPSIK